MNLFRYSVKSPLSFLLPLALATLIAGCGGEKTASDDGGKSQEQSASDGATKAAGKPHFAFVTNSASTFWTIAEKGVRKGEAEFGVEVEMRIPQSGAVDEQQRIIEDLIAKKINGMAISPIDPANMTGILNEAAARMPLITQDSDAAKSNRLAYIGTNNYEAGKIAGEEIKKALPGGGKLMIFVGRLDAQNAVDRRQGILDAIKGANIELVDTRLDYADQAKAKQNVEDTLAAHPDINALAGLWSYNGPAILSAVTAAGKVGQIKIVCFDEEEMTLQGVADGAISATIVQKPFEFGYQSVRLLAEIHKGDKSRIPESRMIDTGVLTINSANVAEFRENLKRLVSP